MLDWTDRHCRYFLRLITPHAWLYTEMVATGAILHGRREDLLAFDPAEHPLALQLGGSDPESLARCARIGSEWGYDEINLNCGCPSDRVQNGQFGACLMGTPDIVAKSVESMRKNVTIPVTVKCRIGIDDCDDFSFLNNFIDIVSKVGCEYFIIHARKAWLKGLSPKENRDIPPLRYDLVEEIKTLYPQVRISLNGGIKTLAQAKDALDRFDGVMIGREAYQNPYSLADLEREIYKNNAILPRETVARAMIPYIERQQKDFGTPVCTITRHMIGLFKGQPGGAIWRRTLSELSATKESPTAQIIETALEKMHARQAVVASA